MCQFILKLKIQTRVIITPKVQGLTFVEPLCNGGGDDGTK